MFLIFTYGVFLPSLFELKIKNEKLKRLPLNFSFYILLFTF